MKQVRKPLDDRGRHAAKRAVKLAAKEAAQQVYGIQNEEDDDEQSVFSLSSSSSWRGGSQSGRWSHHRNRGGGGGRQALVDRFESDLSASGNFSLDMDELRPIPEGRKMDTSTSDEKKRNGEKGIMKSNESRRRRRSWNFLKPMKPQYGGGGGKKSSLCAEISNEAWMCGVCSKSFSSFEAAERHEDFHIREVISDLGFGTFFDQDDNDVDDDNPCSPNTKNRNSLVLGEEEEEEGDDEDKDETVDGYIYHGLSNQNGGLHTPVSSPQQQRQQEDQQQRMNENTPLRSGGLGSFRTPSSKKPRPDVVEVSSPAHYPDHTPVLQRTRKSKLSQDLDAMNSSSGFYDGTSDYNLTTTVLRPSVSHALIEEQQQQTQSQNRYHRHGIGSEHRNLTVNTGQRGDDWSSDEHGLILPLERRDFVVLADEALADVCSKAVPLMLTPEEQDAELELEYLAQDKAYYDMMYSRHVERLRGGRYSRFRTEGKSMLSKVQNKFVDAYQLMKEGNSSRKTTNMDHYTRKLKGDIDTIRILDNSKTTLYVNVIVKASLNVVRHELQRLAKQRWEATRAKSGENDPQLKRFEKFRALAQDNLVKLAEMALVSDFTPRRIAIQLSNDLYRLLTPRLKRRGVSIETEIEYRVGPYFVLAVNVKEIDWVRIVKSAHKDVADAKSKWQQEQEEGKEDEEKLERPGVVLSFLQHCYGLSKLTRLEVMAQVLAWCYYLHWSLYTPLCFLLYHSILGELFRNYFLATVSDEIFYFVEHKGMEMDIDIRNASTQAAFMLSALREIRVDGKETKKKNETDGEQESVLGPLLGPAIVADKGAAPPKPPTFETPETLEFIGLELELSVGFRRLRWALLSSKSTFITEAVFRTESNYENITVGPWSKHDDAIGLGSLPAGLKEDDIIGAEKEVTYLMPKSAFVKANTCYEISYIDVYSDYCFVIRKKTLTPEVPYGSTFVAWTKYVVINMGIDSCKMICSVEAEFPNGPPMISRQIKNGMRAGVGELFVRIGETINKYADHYP